jgi:biotin operon repressor
MKKKNNAKEHLIEYLLSNVGRNIDRDEIISQTGISKSRLSELINEIRAEGYEIITPNRSGIVRLEATSGITRDISSKDVRQWLIILALSKSKSGTATYIELVCLILSIADSGYLYNTIYTDNNYSDNDILEYLQNCNPCTRDDIDYFLPLSTLRKDLQELVNSGVIDKKRTRYKEEMHVVYSISEKSPSILFESDEEMFDFMTFYDNFKNSLSNTEPLDSLYKKSANIYDWESYDSATRIYGKSNRIDKTQINYLNKFVKYPYKKKTLNIEYLGHEGKITLNIGTGLIFYSSETNCFYILCQNIIDESIMQLRLDRICNIQEGYGLNTNYRSSKFLTIYEEMFSASFDSESTHVKVLFEDFGNIKERLTSLHTKREHSKLYEVKPLSDDLPHTIVYEDDLRGIFSFSRYLRSFGSSAIVLEPLELRDLMIQSSKKILKNYKEESYDK